MKNIPYCDNDTVLQHSLKKMNRTKSLKDIGATIGCSASTVSKLVDGITSATGSAAKIKTALMEHFGADDIESLDEPFRKEKTVCRKCGREAMQEWNMCPFCGAHLKAPIERALEAAAVMGKAYKELQQSFPGCITNRFGEGYNNLLHALDELKKENHPAATE